MRATPRCGHRAAGARAAHRARAHRRRRVRRVRGRSRPVPGRGSARHRGRRSSARRCRAPIALPGRARAAGPRTRGARAQTAPRRRRSAPGSRRRRGRRRAPLRARARFRGRRRSTRSSGHPAGPSGQSRPPRRASLRISLYAAAMPDAAAPADPLSVDLLELRGPTITLRIPHSRDSLALLELASDPAVTRWFSWGPYRAEGEGRAYLARLPGQRHSGAQLDLIQVLRGYGPIGITGLSEFSYRDRRAMVGSWLGQAFWGTGANTE